jgi:translation initiation factor 4A
MENNNIHIKHYKNNCSYNIDMTDKLNSWEDLNCDMNLLRGIYSYGFEEPSSIQKQAILPMLSKKDIIAQAQSGTGKTGAFTIGTLGQIDTSNKNIQAIILTPTRELSKQTYTVLNELGKLMKGLKVTLLVGGTSIDDDIAELKKRPQIIVGCPGRINDMVRRKRLNLGSVSVVVLDEADEMLSKGFKEQIYNIFYNLDEENVQIALFSATMSQDLIELSKKLLRDPIKILVKSEALSLEGIGQYYVLQDADNQKMNTLKDLYNSISVSQCIIYCNSLRRVIDVFETLHEEGFPVCCLHSDQSREEREKAYTEFKSGMYRVLVSTNITARGIDIQQVSTVINYDIPKDVHTYLHRIGRSGRWGRKGVGINFITSKDIKKLREIERYYNTEIKELTTDVFK